MNPDRAADACQDVGIVGAGVAGVMHLLAARRAGLRAFVLERQAGPGGLWRQLPAWQDIQISAADWALGTVPLEGPLQPQIVAHLQAWIDRHELADGIHYETPVSHAVHDGEAWALATPGGTWRARHLVAATGAHNVPVVPDLPRRAAWVRELHASALREPGELAGRRVLVVGGGASAFDLIDQALEHGASQLTWAHRGVKWFTPTGKPKAVAGSVRPFAKLQASGLAWAAQSATIDADMRGRYAKFGLDAILPDHAFDVLQDQLIPGRPRMLAHFARLDRRAATVAAIEGEHVLLSDGTSVAVDVLLWGTGYRLDLRWLAVPALQRVTTANELVARCGCGFRSLDAPDLYLPGAGLDGIGSAPFANALMARTIMSHIRGTARLDLEPVGHKINHFDLVRHLAERDPGSFTPGWEARYRALALDTPDDQPYPFPLP